MKKNMKKTIQKFDLLEDIKMLQVNFIMIYIIHKFIKSQHNLKFTESP